MVWLKFVLLEWVMQLSAYNREEIEYGVPSTGLNSKCIRNPIDEYIGRGLSRIHIFDKHR